MRDETYNVFLIFQYVRSLIFFTKSERFHESRLSWICSMSLNFISEDNFDHVQIIGCND
jgi:hypothetical protein